MLHKRYAEKYPDSCDPNTPSEVIYTGARQLTDMVKLANNDIEVGKLILSPTRTYLPVVKQIFAELRNDLHGMIHCTGGGQTKAKKFIQNVRVVKNNLFPVPFLFEMIQQESETNWHEMYQVFNMGHRLEVYLPESAAQRVIEIAHTFDIPAQVIGFVEAAKGAQVRIESPKGTFEY